MYCSLILLQCLCNAFGPPFTKLIYQSLSTNWYMALRFSLAAVVLLVFCGKRIYREWKGKNIFSFVPLYLCTCLSYYLTNIALQYTSSTNVGFIISLPVVIAPIMEMLIYKRAYSRKHIPVLCFLVFGLFLLAFNGSVIQVTMGDFIALLAAVMLAGTLVFGERASRQVDAVALLMPSMVLTAVISLTAAIGFDGILDLNQVGPGAWAGIFYLAVVGSLFVTYLSNVALKKLSSTVVSEIQAVQPVLTAVISYILLKETLGTIAVAGAVIVVAATFVDNRVSNIYEG